MYPIQGKKQYFQIDTSDPARPYYPLAFQHQERSAHPQGDEGQDGIRFAISFTIHRTVEPLPTSLSSKSPPSPTLIPPESNISDPSKRGNRYGSTCVTFRDPAHPRLFTHQIVGKTMLLVGLDLRETWSCHAGEYVTAKLRKHPHNLLFFGTLSACIAWS
jgi:hypothetical protein